MYAVIVERVLRGAFAGLSAGDITAITNKLARDCVHAFIGEHALAGTRNTPDSIRAWYERLTSVLPGISFEIKRIRVRGMPWSTLAVAEWVETNSGVDGVRTSAGGVNVMELRWGKVTRVSIYTDTSALERTLARDAVAGHPDALAAPIADQGANHW